MSARAHAREQRKADLITASTLLRAHAAGATHELADLADGVALRAVQLRAWLANPWVRGAGIAVVAMLAARRWGAPRRPTDLPPARVTRLVNWLALAWRIGRWVGPRLAAWSAGRRGHPRESA